MTNISQRESQVDDLMARFSEALDSVQGATQVQAEQITGGTRVSNEEAMSSQSTLSLLSRFDQAVAVADPFGVSLGGSGRRLNEGATLRQRHDSALETKATPFSDGAGTENQNPRHDLERSSTAAFGGGDEGSNCMSQEERSAPHSELAALQNLTSNGLKDGDGNGNGCSGPGIVGGRAESSSVLAHSTSRSEIQPAVTATFQLGGQTVIEPDAMKTFVQQERSTGGAGVSVASLSDNRSERVQTWVDAAQSRLAPLHNANSSESNSSATAPTTPAPLSSVVRENFRQKKINNSISSALPDSGPLNSGGQSGGAPSSTRLWPSNGGMDGLAETTSDHSWSKRSSAFFEDVEFSQHQHQHQLQQEQNGHDGAKTSNASLSSSRLSTHSDTIQKDWGWFDRTLDAGGGGETGDSALPEASHGSRNYPDGHVAMPSLESRSTRLGQGETGNDGGGREGRRQEEGIAMTMISTGGRGMGQLGEWCPLVRTEGEGSRMRQKAAASPGSTPTSVEAAARVRTEKGGQEGMTPAERAAAGVFGMVGGQGEARAGKFGGVRQPEYGGIPLPEETVSRRKLFTPVELSGDEDGEGKKAPTRIGNFAPT